MKEHHLNYRNEAERLTGCIHKLAKYARGLLWRSLLPKMNQRSKEALFNEQGKKIRRRNVLKCYDPKYNIKQDPDENAKDKSDEANDTSEKSTDKTVNNESVTANTPEIVEENITIAVEEEDSNATKRIAVELYKDKLRKYASDYMELNGSWYNFECIETVSNFHHDFTIE